MPFDEGFFTLEQRKKYPQLREAGVAQARKDVREKIEGRATPVRAEAGIQDDRFAGLTADHLRDVLPAQVVGTEQESLDFDLSTPEHLQELREAAQSMVEAVEAMQVHAAAIGYQGVKWNEYTGEACFAKMRDMFVELDVVLHEYESELQSNAELDITDGEYEEIQTHLDRMVELSDVITTAFPEPEASQDEVVDATVEQEGGATAETGQETPSTQPLQLTPDMRVDTTEATGAKSAAEQLPIMKQAQSLVMSIDANPFYGTTERTTLKWLYEQFKAAADSDVPTEVVQQKYDNLASTITSTMEHPGADALKERVGRIVDSLKQLRFYSEEDRSTAMAMAENFSRLYSSPDTDETVLYDTYQSLETFVTEQVDTRPALFGVLLPEQGEDGVPQVRALRRKLIGVVDTEKSELTRSQRVDIERLISLLDYAAHDTLTDTEVETVELLATRIAAREPVLPYEPPVADSPEDESETAEDDAVAMTGTIAVTDEVDRATDATDTVNIAVNAASELPQAVADLSSLEPAIADETWDESPYEVADLDSLEPDILKETFEQEELAQVAAEVYTEPVPVIVEPVEDDLSEADQAALATVEAADPVNVAEWTNRPTVQSWEERKERRDGVSLAKQYIHGPLAARLKSKGIEPRDIDRKVAGFVASFERRFVSQFDSWLGEQTASVYGVWRDEPLSTLDKLANEFTATRRDELRELYGVKYEAFAAWQDLLQREIRAVVEDVTPDTTLGELVTRYIAMLETQ